MVESSTRETHLFPLKGHLCSQWLPSPQRSSRDAKTARRRSRSTPRCGSSSTSSAGRFGRERRRAACRRGAGVGGGVGAGGMGRQGEGGSLGQGLWGIFNSPSICWVILLTVSGGCQRQKCGCFAFTHHLRGDFDHGKIMRPDLLELCLKLCGCFVSCLTLHVSVGISGHGELLNMVDFDFLLASLKAPTTSYH